MGLHYDETLEALLPSQIGGMQPDKISVPLSSYLSSASGQDKALYQAWLTKLGKKPENAVIAAAVAGNDTVKFTLLALQTDGVTQDASFAAIRDALTTQKWQFVDKLIATKIVTEATDPDTGTVGDVYVKNGIVYVIMTTDSSLLTEALIRLP